MKKKISIALALLWAIITGLYIADPARRHTEQLLTTQSKQTAKDNMLSSLNVTSIAQDRRGLVWIGTSAGINVFDGKNYTQFFHDKKDTTALPDDYINVMHLDRKGRMWVGTQNGVARYEGGGIFRRFALPASGSITAIRDISPSDNQQYITDSGAVVVTCRKQDFLIADGTTPKALPRQDKRGAKTVSSSLPTEESPLPSNDKLLVKPKDIVSTTFRDDNGNLWVGYHNAGYQILSDNRMAFTLANHNRLADETTGRDITCLERVGNHILAGTTLRLYVYDCAADAIEYIFYKDLFVSDKSSSASDKNSSAPDKSSFARNELTSILPIDQERVWLTSDKQVQRCHVSGCHISADARFQAPAGMTYGASAVLRGDAYVCTNTPWLLIFRRDGKHVDSLRIDNAWYNEEAKITPLGDGTLLMVMKDMHMCLLHPEKRTVEEYPVRGLAMTGYIEPAFVMQDSHHNVWLGTKRSGLYRIDLKRHDVKRMTFLNDVHIQAMEEDRLGRLWITTLKDAVCYVPGTGEVFMNSLVSSSQNNWNRQFFDNSICLSPSGCVVLGGSDGCKFVPTQGDAASEAEKLKQTARKLTIYALNVETKDDRNLTLKDDVASNGSYTLAHDENTLEFNFFYPNYSHRASLMFQYMLEGYDKTWQEPTYLHEARYANLPHGDYTFRLRLISSQERAPLAECKIPVSIRRAPWFSLPAWLFYIACFACLIFYINSLYLRIRTNRLNYIQEQHEREREKRTGEMNMNFFANISHEFRNPLTIIAGPLLSLKSSEGLSEEVRSTVNRICISVNRMLRLIDQMLDFNQLEADALRLKVSQVDAEAEMKTLVQAFSDSARMKSITLKTVIGEGNYHVWLDSDKLEKIMSNLFTNALKHTPVGGTICICMQHKYVGSEHYLKISVENSGSHIEEDRMDDVFKRYYQLSDMRKGHHYDWGAGIGLYYVKRLVGLHHGSISVRNVPDFASEGSGVEFSFTLPADRTLFSQEELSAQSHKVLQIPVETDDKKNVQAETNALTKTDNITEGQTDSTHPKTKLLIVDDDIDVAQYIRSIFCHDYELEIRYSAEAALNDMELIQPDLILSDVIMGKMSGYEFCQKLKESLLFSHIPVVMITAKSNISEQIDGLKMGAVAYVTKPFSPSYLMALVASQLKQLMLLRERLSSSTNIDDVPQDLASSLSEQDHQFMDELYSYMEKRMANQDLNVATISRDLLVSQSKFTYKLKELTGETPGAFIRHFKLNKAMQFLQEGKYNVSEIATLTGFATSAHFAVAFKKQFGVSPSEKGKRVKSEE